METDAQSTRDRIVAATIVCLERAGMQSLTVRAIAEEAGVNVAAINYHFGSKSLLIEETLKRSRHQEAWGSIAEL
jgi:AcrR family transcriptional regulator